MKLNYLGVEDGINSRGGSEIEFGKALININF
jgi:hypothetical protein